MALDFLGGTSYLAPYIEVCPRWVKHQPLMKKPLCIWRESTHTALFKTFISNLDEVLEINQGPEAPGSQLLGL